MDISSIDGINVVKWFEKTGFRISVEEGDMVISHHHGEWKPPRHIVVNHLVVLKENKNSALNYLKERKAGHEAWLAAYEAWQNDPDPANDAAHKKRIAESAVAAGLPFYEDGENDHGPEAWLRWAQQEDES